MPKHTSRDQAQQRATALQQEATRLADQAKDQLIEYARSFERTLAKQATQAQAAAHTGRAQLQQTADHVSDQAAAALAAALEAAAGRLNTATGTGPVAQAAHQAAAALEHGSDYLQPWGARNVLRRVKRGVRSAALPALLVAACAVGAAVMANRVRHVAH